MKRMRMSDSRDELELEEDSAYRKVTRRIQGKLDAAAARIDSLEKSKSDAKYDMAKTMLASFAAMINKDVEAMEFCSAGYKEMCMQNIATVEKHIDGLIEQLS